MPIYEYQCPKCEKVHEVMQKFSDAPMTTCPDCEGPVTKMVSMSSFALKGSGWYTTDYKRKGQNPEKAQAAAEASGNTAGKTDAAPATGASTTGQAAPAASAPAATSPSPSVTAPTSAGKKES